MTEATLLLRPDEDEERQQQLPDFAAFEKKILNTWRQNPSTSYASVVEDIDLLFKRSQSPSMVFLELCERASLAIMNKTASSLHMAVVKYYVRWVDANPENRANHAMYLDRTVQDKAASLMFKLAPTLMSYFDELYTFDNLSKSMQEHAQEFLRIGAYLTAFHIIMHYKLFENFQMNQILPPLLLKKECGRVEEYLRDKPVMQREFTQWMDSLMILRYDELTRIVNVYVDIPLSAVDAISGKTLEKQIWRNFGRYNLSLADIPNSKKQRSEAALRHVHYELCNMNQLDYGQYLDHVKYALETNKSLQLYYVKLLLGYGDIKEASRWANFCNFSTRLVKNSDLRKRLRLDTPDALAFPNYVKDVDTAIRRTSPTGPYGLESFTVDFVGSMQKLKLLTERLRATKDTIIALDAEFRPMYIACVEKVALLQVAFDNCVFLVDTLSLEENDEEKQALWKDFFETLFTTEDNLKIGFAFSGDVKVISSSSPHLADLGQRMKLVGCMSKLVLAMYEKNPRSVPPLPLNPDGKPQFKLADLMYGVTNRQMDKKEQLSNWDRRPLRKEQMDYAAMDVISLMHIYSNLQRSASEHGVDFSECEKECILHVSATPKRPAVKKRKGKADQEAFYNLVDAMGSLNVDEQAKTVDDMKFICDSMLLGVGKDLRKCGIDAMLCSNSGKSYQRLVSAYPGNVLSLETGQQSLAAVETILKKYNIRVTVDDLFSRCQKCNYKCFVFVPYLVMIWMMKLTDKSLKPEERVEMIETFTTIEASDESGGYEARLVYKDAESAVFQMDSGYVDAGKAHVSLPHQPQEVVKVKIGALIPAVITEDKKFFRICGFCGKVYWDGGHLTNYQDVMNDSGLLHVEESEAAESEVAMTSQ
ncbi:hypothetical protein QR680_016747 [Steinernema hermaphroditum]|uniref:3'-5' exonuclease domain-containing protein n=1 Tax=Steinernema hermaphroditum TaxID=289476 RepID=A0AA39HC63_9BILA|nr:hypothetical protein QR680_016747 [Steinernema hermaphroditum]